MKRKFNKNKQDEGKPQDGLSVQLPTGLEPQAPDPIDHDFLENCTKFDTVKKALMIQALSNTLQNVSVSAQRVGISRTTHYKWMESDPLYAQAVNDTLAIAVNHVESYLGDQIASGNVTAQIFWLKYRGRDFGYAEKVEVQHSGSIRTQIEQMTDAEFAAYVKKLEAKYLGESGDTEQA